MKKEYIHTVMLSRLCSASQQLNKAEALNKDTFRATRRVGFTLVELLVVVLIIGILSAIALPQYQKTVEKTKTMQGLILLKSMVQATEEYYLANGRYPEKFSDLSIELPADYVGNDLFYPIANAKEARSNGIWSIILESRGENQIEWLLNMGILSGKHKGAGFSYIAKHNNTQIPIREIVCIEVVNMGGISYNPAGGFCKELFQGTLVQTGGLRVYKLP